MSDGKARTDLVEKVATSGYFHEKVERREISSPPGLFDGELRGADELEDMSVLERCMDSTFLLHGLHLPVRKVGSDDDHFASGDAVALGVYRLVYSGRYESRI